MSDSAQSAGSCKALVRALCGKVFLGGERTAEHWQGLGKGSAAREDAWMRHLEARAYEILLDMHDVSEQLGRMAVVHGACMLRFWDAHPDLPPAPCVRAQPADQRMDRESRPGQVAGGISWASSYLTDCRQYSDAQALPDLARRLRE